MAKVRSRPFTSNRLKRLRLSITFTGHKPATQFEVAEAIGVGLNRYYMLEASQAQPTPRELQRLARVFNVRERDLGLVPRESSHVLFHK
jgi:transcriptional regulator with XRE-family HTH domain